MGALTVTGQFFPFLSPLLGWFGVFITGSDTSSNALFSNIQSQTAQSLGINPVLSVAANSSGGAQGGSGSGNGARIHPGRAWAWVCSWLCLGLGLSLDLFVALPGLGLGPGLNEARRGYRGTSQQWRLRFDVVLLASDCAGAGYAATLVYWHTQPVRHA